MQRLYRATIEVAIRADDFGEASDAIAVLMTESGMHANETIADWAYSYGPVPIEVSDKDAERGSFFSAGDLNKGKPTGVDTLKAPDLKPYQQALPDLVDLEVPVGHWSLYLWNGILLQAVTELPNGSVVRYQDINPDMLSELEAINPDMNAAEVFASVAHMTEYDVEVETGNAV